MLMQEVNGMGTRDYPLVSNYMDEFGRINPEPTNEFDGHIYHDDGSKSFVDGAGKVGGVNARGQVRSKKTLKGIDDEHIDMIPNNEHDGHFHNEDGSKDFVDGTGTVGGVNNWN